MELRYKKWRTRYTKGSKIYCAWLKLLTLWEQLYLQVRGAYAADGDIITLSKVDKNFLAKQMGCTYNMHASYKEVPINKFKNAAMGVRTITQTDSVMYK